MMRVVRFELRRLWRSYLAGGLLLLTVLLTALFFWFAQVGVGQYRTQLLQDLESKDQSVGQEVNGLQFQIKQTDDAAVKKVLRAQLNLASRTDDGIMAQIKAVKQRNSPAFIAGGLQVSRYGPQFNKTGAGNSAGWSDQQLLQQKQQYQTLQKEHQAFESPTVTMQAPGLLVNWQRLLASPLTLVLVILILSTLWVTAVFTANRQWMQLNVQPAWHWLAANWAVMSGIWLMMLLIANGCMFLFARFLGSPLLSGTISWTAVLPGSKLTYWQAWLLALGQSWVSFIGGYGVWLGLTQWIQRRRRG